MDTCTVLLRRGSMPPFKDSIHVLQVHEYYCEEAFQPQVEFHFSAWLALVFYPVAQCSLCGPQTHELANECMRLHLVPVEFHLWVLQYHLGYHCCLRFTRVVPFYPIGVHWFLCIILGFSDFFPHAIPFFLVAFLIIFRS
jgi:hypothetical protein